MLGAVNMVIGTKIDFQDLSNKTCIFSFIYYVHIHVSSKNGLSQDIGELALRQ